MVNSPAAMSVSCFWSFFQLYEMSTLEEGRWGICKNSVPFCNFPLSLKLLQKKTLNKLLFTVITVNKFLLQNRKPRRPYQWLTSQQENLWHFLYLGTRKDRISRHSAFFPTRFWLMASIYLPQALEHSYNKTREAINLLWFQLWNLPSTCRSHRKGKS